MVGEVRLALTATVDTVRVEVDVVGKAHDVFVPSMAGREVSLRWRPRQGSKSSDIKMEGGGK
jgi:hypothetical protein